ncbi:MAG: ROK family protein [Thermoleophilia bacterium]|nr:ROK family protein [Thermoleophilia bacterium]
MDDQHVIALDLGGTKLAGGIVDREGVVLRRTEHPTATSSQAALLAQLEATIEELLDDRIGALGVGIPSLIDQRAGRAGASVNVPLAGVDLREQLSSRFRLPVALENDANAAALAEQRFGAGRGSDHMVMITLGTGIGGGLILNGELYRGALGTAGELGHLTIQVDGPPCQGFCPGIGHFEALASGTAADRMADRIAAERPDGALARELAAGRDLSPPLVVALANEGHADACEVLQRIGYFLGHGIANYVNVFNPELVVIGGGFSRAGELLLEPARRVVAERALPIAREYVRITLAVLGAEAGLIGSGLVGFEALDLAAARPAAASRLP